MNHDDRMEVPADDLINVLYHLQASLKILTEQLARHPNQGYILRSRDVDFLYVCEDNLRRHLGLRCH
jgi:hypothetical protein